jgi:hypothetical protein
VTPRRRLTPAAGLGLAALAVLTACKGSSQNRSAQDRAQEPPVAAPAPVDAVTADANLEACRAAAAGIASLPPNQRAQALLDACKPCGDWEPLLGWNKLQEKGGPTRAAIEQAMTACKAYCEPNARQRFLGTLDGARGQATQQPWRLLGEICKADVSAVPDTRFMGGTYFALDRIARVLGDAQPPIAVPLPALTVSGVGFELPRASRAPLSDLAVTASLSVDAAQMLLGSLPFATLSATGLQVSPGYPGDPVAPAALAAVLAGPRYAGQPVAVLAPHAMPAGRIADAVAAAGGHDLRLAIGVAGPGEWMVPAAMTVSLNVPAKAKRGTPRPAGAATAPAPADLRFELGAAASGAILIVRQTDREVLSHAQVTIVIDDTARVESLASLLTALAGGNVTSVALVRGTGAPSDAKPTPPKP